MEERYTQEDIDQYIKNQLSAEKKLAFEAQLANDKALQQEVAATQQAVEALAYTEKQHFLNALSQVQENLTTEGFFLNEDDLDDYLLGKGDDKKQAQIEYRIGKDESFKKDYERLEKAKESLQYAEKEKFKTTLKEVEQALAKEKFFDKKKSPISKVIPLRRYLSIAAAIALLALGLWWMLASSPTSANLYADNFEIIKNEGLIKQVQPKGFAKKLYHEQLHQALLTYHANQYTQSIPLFDAYLTEAPNTDIYYADGQFFYALALMQAQQFKQAIPLLEALTQQQTSYKSKAAWYLALAYLKTGQISDIKSLSEGLPEKDTYALKLQDLIRKVETIEN